MKVIKPHKLSPGDTIGIVAASLPVLDSFRENYERGKKLIQGLGFKIKEGQTIGKSRWWMAATAKEVAQDINFMFKDKSVKAIFAQTGGYSAISVLEYLDFEMIKNNPKPFIGMSDMTIYHLAILAKTRMVGFHMADVSFGFGREIRQGQESWSKLDQEFFLKFLTKTTAPGIIKPISEWEVWKSGEAKGALIGGILERISILCGTPYFPDIELFNGSILFWEEVGRDVTEIYQYLSQLKSMGVFEKISGMLIGKIKYLRPLRETEIIVPSIKDLVLDVLKEYGFPIMANLDFGHFTVNIPMPIGINVSFNTSKKQLNFLEAAVT